MKQIIVDAPESAPVIGVGNQCPCGEGVTAWIDTSIMCCRVHDGPSGLKVHRLPPVWITVQVRRA